MRPCSGLRRKTRRDRGESLRRLCRSLFVHTDRSGQRIHGHINKKSLSNVGCVCRFCACSDAEIAGWANRDAGGLR